MHTTRRKALCFIAGASVAPAIAAATARTATSAPPIVDPLLETIRAYQAGLSDFMQNAPEDNEGSMEYSDVSYGPPLARLQMWTEPARTRDGAIEALRLATDHNLGVGGMEAGDRLMRAVLGYLESLPT